MTKSTTDLTTSSQQLDPSSDYLPRGIPFDHTAASLSNPIVCIDLIDGGPSESSTSSSSKQSTSPQLSKSSSTIAVGREPTRRQCREYLSRLAKTGINESHEGNTTRGPKDYSSVRAKQRERRTRKRKEHSQARLKDAERVTGVIPSQQREQDIRQRIDSSDTTPPNLRSTNGLRAAIAQQRGSLPTPPDSDTSIDLTDRCSGKGSNRTDRVPTYRFVPVPPSPSDNTSSSTRTSPSSQVSISSCSTPEQTNIFESTCAEDTVTSRSGALQPIKASEIGSVPRVSSTTKISLLNLVWHDIGNGTSRAYPRDDVPPLSSPTLPGTLPILIEGLDYFIYSDEDTSVTQDSPSKHKSAANTTGANDRLYLDNIDTEKTSLNPTSKTLTLPSYSFIPTPQLTTTQFSSTPEPGVLPTTPLTTSISTIHTSVLPPIDDHHPTNIHPIHLTPPHLLSIYTTPTPATDLDRYNANTSSGFSDTDTEHKQNKPPLTQEGRRVTVRDKHERMRRRKQKQKRNAENMADCVEIPSLTRVAVVRAAERLNGLLGRKKL